MASATSCEEVIVRGAIDAVRSLADLKEAIDIGIADAGRRSRMRRGGGLEIDEAGIGVDGEIVLPAGLGDEGLRSL